MNARRIIARGLVIGFALAATVATVAVLVHHRTIERAHLIMEQEQ